MFALNQTILAFGTFITGTASICMLLLFIDEIFKKINNKLSSSVEEKRELRAKLEILKNENDELLEKNFQMSLTIDDLHTEINRIQPEDELVEENKRLVAMCGTLHIKCHKLNQQLKEFDSLEISNIKFDKSSDSIITNKLMLSYP